MGDLAFSLLYRLPSHNPGLTTVLNQHDLPETSIHTQSALEELRDRDRP